MLGALVACKKKDKDNRPSLEPVLVDTKWEAYSFAGEMNASVSGSISRSWASTKPIEEKTTYTYKDIQQGGSQNLFGIFGSISFAIEFKTPINLTEEDGDSQVSYNADGVLDVFDAKPQCIMGETIIATNFFDTKEDATLIALIQSQYLKKEVCIKYRTTTQRYFHISSGYLYYTGIKSIDEANIYEKDSKKEIGRGRSETIGSWNAEYAKK
jgi:hypothetical protein